MYSNIVGQFLNSLRALKLYVERTEPLTNFCHDEKDVISDPHDSILGSLMWAKNRGLSLQEVLEIVDNDAIEITEKNTSVENKESVENDKGTENGEDVKRIEKENDRKEKLKKIADIIDDYYKTCSKNGALNSNFFMMPKQAKKQYHILESKQKQNEILYSGSLMLLITYFENLFSKIFHHIFLKYPKQISIEEKAVTFKMLESTNNIDDIKNILIDEEVTKMMYKAYSDWILYLTKNMKLNLKFIDESKQVVTEIIARRNLLVHNDGIINTFYLNLVGESIPKGLKKGDVLIINREYIDRAINIVECAGVSLVIELWLKECNMIDEEIEKITNFIFDEYLTQEKWEDAKIFYEICLANKKLSTADQLICQINRWLCYKMLGQFEKIKKEVEDVDISAAQPRYKLAKLALLDKNDQFFDLFDKQSDLDEIYLHEWPLFISLRESEAYQIRFKKTAIEETNDDEIEEDVVDVEIIEELFEDDMIEQAELVEGEFVDEIKEEINKNNNEGDYVNE